MKQQIPHKPEEKGTRMGICVNHGVRHYLSIVKPGFRHNWLPAVIYLLCCIGLILPTAMALKGSVHPIEWFKGSWPWILVLVIIGGVAECLFYGSHLSYLKEPQEDTEKSTSGQDAQAPRQATVHWMLQLAKDGWRVIQCAVINLAMILLPLLIPASAAYYFVSIYDPTATEAVQSNGEGAETVLDAAPPDVFGILQQHSLSLGLLACAVAVVWLLLVPVSYVSLRYLRQSKGSFLSALRHHYGVAMRHYGFVFAINLLAVLFILLLSVVVCLPMTILLGALCQAFIGVSQGDSVLLPSYFLPLLGVVTAVMAWTQLLLRTLYLFILNEIQF